MPTTARVLPPEPLGRTVEQTSQMLTLGKTRIYELIASGELKSFKVGRRRIVTNESIHKLVHDGVAG